MVESELTNLFLQKKTNSRQATSSMGYVLRQERIRQGKTITTVAKAIGVSPAYISQIESGKKKILP